MNRNFEKIQSLLQEKADYLSREKFLEYDGSVEIKMVNNEKYLYIRKREAGKNTSKYVDKYSDELHSLLLKQTKEMKVIKKEVRRIEKELALLGYVENDLSPRIVLNVEFARVNIKNLIYDQAVLEGVATTFPQTETIIENGKVNGVTASDVQKILNLKHAWEFILDSEVVLSPSNYYLLSYISKIINEGFYENGGRIRCVPVSIGGSIYIPPIPIEAIVKERIDEIINSNLAPIDIAIELCLYCMKTQIFNDGNKRASIIFANQYLISKGEGLLVVPESKVSEFKRLLVEYYEGKNEEKIKAFMKEQCWRKF